jgi:hypothetical protein
MQLSQSQYPKWYLSHSIGDGGYIACIDIMKTMESTYNHNAMLFQAIHSYTDYHLM